MSAKPELEEVKMTREIKVLYFDTMKNSPEFHRKPFLDREMFRQHFATVAHRHKIFHTESPEGRNQYNLYFGLCWNRMKEAIGLLAKNEAKIHPPTIVTPQPRRQEPPEQLCFSCLDPRVAEARKKLAILRDEFAARPNPQW